MGFDFRRAELACVAGRLDQCPRTGYPEVVLSGRSNVGKSSLINAITDQRKLARVSQTPGKTRLIIYFSVDRKFYLTDLPGYGYARVARSVQENFSKLVDGYLTGDRPIRLVLHLLDIRIEPNEFDHQMLAWLQGEGIQYLIVLTKSDKLSRQAANLRLKEMSQILNIDPDYLVLFSAENRQGVDSLREQIRAVMN
jgi:GTP-binding protein